MKYQMFAAGKETMYLDLKREEGSKILKQVVERSDVLIDPFRPGVLERLGLGSDELCQLNPRLVYARLSGFGQTGPMAQQAGHDINYVGLSGALSRLGFDDRPPIPPMNILADFAGGGVLCALGIVMCLLERAQSGKGQVVDLSMTEGAAYVSSFFWETLKQKEIMWPNWPHRASNLLDFGSPFYRSYECKDEGHFLAVGALEEKFYKNFIQTIGLDEERFNRFDTESWPEMAEAIQRIIKTKTRDEWASLFEKVDACVTPVLDVHEVKNYPQHLARNSFSQKTGMPNPAPLLSRTPAARDESEVNELQSETRSILKQLGYSKEEIKNLEDEYIIDGEAVEGLQSFL